jgi:hypothetical protein
MVVPYVAVTFHTWISDDDDVSGMRLMPPGDSARCDDLLKMFLLIFVLTIGIGSMDQSWNYGKSS